MSGTISLGAVATWLQDEWWPLAQLGAQLLYIEVHL
jgi:hypothetical protein